MKKALTLLLLIVLATIAACTTQTVVNPGENTPGAGTVINERTVVSDRGDGRLVTAVTGTAARQLKVTIDNIELYSPARGWVTIAGDSNTYDLSAPRQLYLAGDQDIAADTYTQLRLHVSSATLNDQVIDVPGQKFLVPMNLAVPSNATAVIVLDIHGDESLQTVTGRYVFTPIVSVNACVNAAVSIDGRVVTTSCYTQPTVITYQEQPSGQTVVTNVVREVPVITVTERTVYNNTYNTTTVYNNTVYVPSNNTNGTSGSAGTSGNTTNGTNSSTTATTSGSATV